MLRLVIIKHKNFLILQLTSIDKREFPKASYISRDHYVKLVLDLRLKNKRQYKCRSSNGTNVIKQLKIITVIVQHNKFEIKNSFNNCPTLIWLTFNAIRDQWSTHTETSQLICNYWFPYECNISLKSLKWVNKLVL